MGMRIISLIASATEIVHALEMGHCQVGRSHECDFPPQVDSLPVCTQPKFPVEGNSREIDTAVKDVLREAVSVYDVLEEKLERLQPTHIVTQSQCEVCAVSLKDVERALSQRLTCDPEIVSLEPYSLGDVWTDIRTVADSLGIPERGRELVSELQHRIRLRCFPRQDSPDPAQGGLYRMDGAADDGGQLDARAGRDGWRHQPDWRNRKTLRDLKLEGAGRRRSRYPDPSPLRLGHAEDRPRDVLADRSSRLELS